MVNIDNYRVISTGWKRKDRLHLRSATEVHWRGLQQTWAEKWRLHAVLSVLPTIPNIQLLSLHNADISKAQQAIILGLLTLRTLVVHSCRFHPSTKPLPLSHVTTLKLTLTDLKTTRRLLTIFASTIETLEIGLFDGIIDRVMQGGLIELPRLSKFTIQNNRYGTRSAVLDTLKRWTLITTICVISHQDLAVLSLHDSDLPALRSVTCDHRLAMRLIPKRPVTTYVEVHASNNERHWSLHNAFSQTRAQITSLNLLVPYKFYSFLPALAPFLQNLEQLTLTSANAPMHWLGARPPDHLSGQEPPAAAAVILPKLKRVAIWMEYYRFIHTTYPAQRLLKECFIPACPALEVFDCLGVYHCSGFQFARPLEPKRAWRARRLPDGSWERQGRPPIPTYVPATKLNATP